MFKFYGPLYSRNRNIFAAVYLIVILRSIIEYGISKEFILIGV